MSQDRIAFLQLPDETTDNEMANLRDWLKKNQPPGLKIIIARNYGILTRQEILDILRKAP